MRSGRRPWRPLLCASGAEELSPQSTQSTQRRVFRSAGVPAGRASTQISRMGYSFCDPADAGLAGAGSQKSQLGRRGHLPAHGDPMLIRLRRMNPPLRFRRFSLRPLSSPADSVRMGSVESGLEIPRSGVSGNPRCSRVTPGAEMDFIAGSGKCRNPGCTPHSVKSALEVPLP